MVFRGSATSDCYLCTQVSTHRPLSESLLARVEDPVQAPFTRSAALWWAENLHRHDHRRTQRRPSKPGWGARVTCPVLLRLSWRARAVPTTGRRRACLALHGGRCQHSSPCQGPASLTDHANGSGHTVSTVRRAKCRRTPCIPARGSAGYRQRALPAPIGSSQPMHVVKRPRSPVLSNKVVVTDRLPSIPPPSPSCSRSTGLNGAQIGHAGRAGVIFAI